MHEFLVNFQDIRSDDTIAVHDDKKRKKQPGLGDHVKTYDASGNVCYGFIERLDGPLGIFWIALDRKTWESASYA